jgi:hypothetical protein
MALTGHLPIAPGDIAIGEPIPYDVCDRRGTKLLAKGQQVRSAAQLERLLEIGLWAEEQAVRVARRAQGRAAAAATPALSPALRRVNVLDELRALRTELDALLGAPQAASPEGLAAIVAGLPGLAARVRRAVALDADAALATLLWLREPPYGARQAVNTAIMCELLLGAREADGSLRDATVMAALAMNLCIHALQETLYHQSTADPRQKAEIAAHPGCAARRLRAAGLGDPVVLAALEQHHESFDGSGYPARLAGEAIALPARVIAVADRYCAAISERAYRPAVPASVALGRLFTPAAVALDPSISALLERALGRWPPGTVVRLRSGETAIVVRRTSDASGCVARVVRNRDGLPTPEPARRLTQREGYAVVEELPRDRVPAAIDVPALWNPAVESAEP